MTTPAEVTADLKARVGRKYRRSSSATGIPQHVVMFEVPVDSVETRREQLLAIVTDPGHRARLLAADSRHMDGPAKRRRIDALAVGQWGPVAGRLIGFEVKATRADLLTELRDPLKAEAGARYCHEWWLVLAHIDLAKGIDLPADWGILAPYGAGLKAHRHPGRRTPTPATGRLVAAITASATNQAIANDVRPMLTVARELAARRCGEVGVDGNPLHPELTALVDRLDAQHRARFG